MAATENQIDNLVSLLDGYAAYDVAEEVSAEKLQEIASVNGVIRVRAI